MTNHCKSTSRQTKSVLIFVRNLFVLQFVISFPIAAFSQQLSVRELRCEHKIDPVGVEAASPALSWEIRSDKRSTVQTAYRVLVADDLKLLELGKGNIWDSQKVPAATSIQVKFAGKALRTATTYYWKVIIWDNHGRTSGWSSAATWQTGLFSVTDWAGAKWIAYEELADSSVNVLPIDGKKDQVNGNNVLPLLRKTFELAKPVKRATLFICGLGQFEARLNGKKLGDHFLDPGWTKYDKQAQYVVFDVTRELKRGENALGVMLGNGFYYVPPVKERYRKLKSAFGYPKMICRMLIQYADGSSRSVISDLSWKAAPGPVIFSSIYGGEDYDASKERNGWDSPAYNDKNWKNVLPVDGPPQLNAQLQEPVKLFDRFVPRKLTEPLPGKKVYDLGQNASAIVEIAVNGNAGDTVRLVPAELLKDDGSVTQRSSGSPFYFNYILKGGGPETWKARFTYYGFRYVQAEVLPKDRRKPATRILSLAGIHIRNAAPLAGSFFSSSDLFNQTDTLINWAIKSNMMSLFTDCPHREKLGWLEQLHLMGASVRYNYQIENLLRKSVTDMINSQTPDGLVPEIAPEYVHFTWGGDMFRDSPEWGSSAIIVPWYMYQWYGDQDVLRESYPMMQRYLDYLATKAKGNILSQGLGDWYDLGPKPPGVSQLTPMGVTGTAIYYYDLKIVALVARMLKKTTDAERYEALAGVVKDAFNNTFFDKKNKQYGGGSQTANAMALFAGVVAQEDRKAVIDNLVKDITDRGFALTAGDIGYRYVLRVLEREGRSDVIYAMNSRSDVPGYGMQLKKGATALTESWAALPANSNNHFMLGHLLEWLYSGVGGIRQEALTPAFANIVIRPEAVGDLTAAKARYHSPYGWISTDWKKSTDAFELKVSIPPNSKATVYLPAAISDDVTEAAFGKTGLAFVDSPELRMNGFENGKAIIAIGSGDYVFTVKKRIAK